ncbi:Eco57I restriction-modification methylase domain-containing protein [Halocola ammonii]
MKDITVDIPAAQKSIEDSLALIVEGKKEQVIRDSFTSFLRKIFPEQPGWVIRHIQGSEASVKVSKGEKTGTGFVDNLVDLTAIEYEGNLTSKPKFDTGYGQVQDYCASLINDGHDPELVIGILSDTIRWYAYKIDVENLPEGKVERSNIPLIQIDSVDCSAGTVKDAKDLVNFLIKYLARVGSRTVTANAIAKDLGFESPFGQTHVKSLTENVVGAFKNNPKYADLISELWCSFVSYLREEGVSDQFDLTTYVDEYYILTLGKLLCANYIEGQALSSDRDELASILDGRFFENRGLVNFVEYDYFGWLNSTPYIEELIPVAEAIQQDLVAYNFKEAPNEDLFGRLMAQLAHRSQRLLLGQEWTPSWLSHQLVSNVVDQIPEGQNLFLLDMCCGSGSMIVEAINIAKSRITKDEDELSSEGKLNLLVQSITGFDIDPLAVMLSKVNWVLTTMDWLQPLGSHQVTIPVYHADSLFAITPISQNTNDEEDPVFSLKIAEYTIDLPDFLVSPDFKSLFDALIDITYRIVIDAAGQDQLELSASELKDYYDELVSHVEIEISEDQESQILGFLGKLIEAIDKLNRDGRNGIWPYILRNSFRPGLVAGQFNGLVSNPPWLALSKVANNPYQAVLKRKAISYEIKPPGSSHLHIELATIFLLHAVEKYLTENAKVGCIVPETVLNGHHQNPFRKFQFFNSPQAVSLDITEIWKIEKHVFKNNAVVLFGEKSSPNPDSTEPIPGKLALSNGSFEDIVFYRNKQGERTAWSEQEISEEATGFYTPANFRQGADIMPRKLLFYEVSPTPNPAFVKAKSIDPIKSPLAFTVKDAKKNKDFNLTERVLQTELIFDVITSNLLTPFNLADVQKALLPIKKDDTGHWEMISEREVRLKGAPTRNTFRAICNELDTDNASISDLFDLINERGKLVQQVLEKTGYLVFTGAGGGRVCSAYLNIEDCDFERLVLDQTVYWAQVETEDEAIYLTGLLNSEAIGSIIEDFQPRGAFGKRHIHKLPFGVTPPFDPSQAGHQDVVNCTRSLLKEYEGIKAGPADLVKALDPNSAPLHIRRKKIWEYIKELNSYEEYEEACKALYGV